MRKFLTRLIHCQQGHLPAATAIVVGARTDCSMCLRCGASLGRHLHTWSAWTPTDKHCLHVKTCETCGAQLVEHLHTWLPAGLLQYSCSACGIFERHMTSPIAQAGHNPGEPPPSWTGP
jgi:ribosomal protein L40E